MPGTMWTPPPSLGESIRKAIPCVAVIRNTTHKRGSGQELWASWPSLKGKTVEPRVYANLTLFPATFRTDRYTQRTSGRQIDTRPDRHTREGEKGREERGPLVSGTRPPDLHPRSVECPRC